MTQANRRNFKHSPRLHLIHENIDRHANQSRTLKNPAWKIPAAAITRTFQFKDFPAAIQFVEAVAGLAEQVWHHPDIDIRWNKVTLTLSTHEAGGLSEKDFDLARQFDRLAPR